MWRLVNVYVWWSQNVKPQRSGASQFIMAGPRLVRGQNGWRNTWQATSHSTWGRKRTRLSIVVWRSLDSPLDSLLIIPFSVISFVPRFFGMPTLFVPWLLSPGHVAIFLFPDVCLLICVPDFVPDFLPWFLFLNLGMIVFPDCWHVTCAGLLTVNSKFKNLNLEFGRHAKF